MISSDFYARRLWLDHPVTTAVLASLAVVLLSVTIVEAVLSLDYIKDLQKLDAYKEVLDSTQIRRFFQMVSWFERELGASWPELLDRLGGGGAALATKLGDNSPALLVVQGTDEKALHKFAMLLLSVIEQEQERQGSKERPVKSTYKDVPTVRIGKRRPVCLKIKSRTARRVHNGEAMP